MNPNALLNAILVALAAAVLFNADANAFEWPRANPDEVGIDAAAISMLDDAARRGDYGQLKSVLLIRHGKLVYEAYFNGHHADELFPLYSVTKSWASALVGIAIANGDLSGVEQPLHEVFQQYADEFNTTPSKRDLTVHDLLTMRHGFQWDEWSTLFTDSTNPVNQMTRSADWWRFVLGRPQTAARDSVFRYSTGVSNLLGGLIFSATGQSAIEYAGEHLFEPLDIADWHIEVDLSGSPRGTGITQFQDGLTPTGHGLWLRAQDLAKIGQLYLDGGVWQGHRILPSEWIEDSWRAYSDHSTDPDVFTETGSYGYQWWGVALQNEHGSLPVHVAEGFADQFIIVAPDLDLVVVSTAQNGNWSGDNITDGLIQHIAPAVDPGFDPVSDAGLTGSWYAPELPHQGFMLEVVAATGQVVIYWMTFEPGTGKQQWMIAVGTLNGRRSVLEFLRPVDGAFVGTKQADLQQWGDVELEFTSCTTATLDFASPVAGVEGQINLRRLTPNAFCDER